jgi:hypothetical protein
VLLADGVCLCALVYFTKQIFPLGYISAVLGIASVLVGAGLLFISVHDETPSVVTVGVNKPGCSPSRSIADTQPNSIRLC